MLKKVTLSVLLCLLTLVSYAQVQIFSKSKYVDIVTKGDLVYGISKTNKLVVWDMIKGDVQYVKKNINCIHRDNNNAIFCASTTGEVLKETGDNQWTEVYKFTGQPYAIFNTSDNQIIALSSKGIKYKKSYYLPSEKHRIGNGTYNYKKNQLDKPNLTYIDQNNRVWISYDLGKFTEVFIFDPSKGDFLHNKLLTVEDDKKEYRTHQEYLREYKKRQAQEYPYYMKRVGSSYLYRFPVEAPLHFGLKSVCQDNGGNYYFSQGLPYSHKQCGIFVYEKTKDKGFYRTIEHFENYFKKQHEIFGAVTFNSFNNTIYYYSNYGFHKLVSKDSKLTSELVVDPNVLLYKAAIPHQYGNLMNVKKISFLDETRFVFLTAQYGFGYFDGENINLFN